MTSAFEDFIASRIDVTDATVAGYRQAQARLGDLADREPRATTPAGWQAWVAANAELSPGTLGVYLSAVRQVLDFADVEPNPRAVRR